MHLVRDIEAKGDGAVSRRDSGIGRIVGKLRRKLRRGWARHRRLAAREAADTVGTCRVCGVAFAGDGERHGMLRQLLASHERICPGGGRTGEVVRPLG